MGAALIVVVSACSDDGLTVQDQNSSSTAATNAVGESTGDGQLTSANDEQGGSASGSGNTADPDGATSETGLGDAETGPAGSTDASGTTGSNSDSGTTDASGTTGGTTASGTSEGTSEGSTTDACQPITEDPSGIGLPCRSDFDCLPEYTCQPFEGFVFQQTCQILCTMDCECPAGLACFEVADKSGAVWYQCG